MIEARDFVDAARAQGFDLYAGVPCSFLTPFINYVIGDAALRYVSAANEGDAVAIAAGAFLGGGRGVAMMQNSGLGNAVSPLTSLTWTFRIPVLVVCTHRGAPGTSDEPQHELMGAITGRMLDTMSVPWSPFPDLPTAIDSTLARVNRHFTDEHRPYALVMQKGTCAPCALPRTSVAAAPSPMAITGTGRCMPALRQSRHALLTCLREATGTDNTVIIATTGFTGRELYAIDDRDNHLYMVGSMGCAASLGLGLALTRPDLRVIVVDGDGAALMRLGNLATIGAYRPRNFVHLLLDNEAHDSTGAQATVSAATDFAAIAAACGYASVHSGDTLEDLIRALASSDGPVFLHAKIRPGAGADLPRPTIAPSAVRERLMRHIGTR
jgi:phosphonopyruvate decarboxylase